MSNKKVTVVIATYRREDPLKNALDSIAAQTYEDLEIVLVDDNDNPEWNEKVTATVAAFREKHPSLSLIYEQNHPNQGSALSRNIGINLANGKYITFLDDDDIFLPRKVENQCLAMQTAQADFSLTDLSLYYEDETLCEIRSRKYLLSDEKNDLLVCHLKYHMTGTDTMMFRTEYLRSFGGFDPIDVGDEFYLMMKAITSGGAFLYVPQNDVKAYVHRGEGGLSSGQGKIDGENRLYEYKKQFFAKLKHKDRSYIKMRHHAVLAFAYKRSGRLLPFFCEGVKAALISPFQCIKLLANSKGA